MATTLSYGFQKPVTGDKGSVFWPILESDIQKLNDHTHNGSNSAKITAASQTAVTQAVTSGSWTLVSGSYRQLVTLPAGLTNNGGTVDDFSLQFRNAANGRVVLLSSEKVSGSTYYLYTNDNTLNVTAVYT